MATKLLINHKINRKGQKVVSAKELYLGLGLNKAVWSRWYLSNIEKNEFFLENKDWVGVQHNVEGNKTMDFEITLEFAKHIAMMARTEKSHEYRNYFLDLEKQVDEVSKTMNIKGNMSLKDWNEIRFSEKRTINTFANCDMNNIRKLVDEFVDYAEMLDTKTRVVRCKSAVKGLERLHDKLASESVTNIGNCYNILRLEDEIKKIKHMAENRHRGQKIAHRNKKIKQLENKIS
ncbi:antA/AntB antirepressor family protein [Clostridium novyi]|uniref:antA/AntB antirepressor family protein n=1 Tax=Clostridium novyi TaxID=1542 RepID=UPI00069EAEA2|nr:antA/AntB antirepressor family protein [Clostridium novyi]